MEIFPLVNPNQPTSLRLLLPNVDDIIREHPLANKKPSGPYICEIFSDLLRYDDQVRSISIHRVGWCYYFFITLSNYEVYKTRFKLPTPLRQYLTVQSIFGKVLLDKKLTISQDTNFYNTRKTYKLNG